MCLCRYLRLCLCLCLCLCLRVIRFVRERGREGERASRPFTRVRVERREPPYHDCARCRLTDYCTRALWPSSACAREGARGPRGVARPLHTRARHAPAYHIPPPPPPFPLAARRAGTLGGAGTLEGWGVGGRSPARTRHGRGPAEPRAGTNTRPWTVPDKTCGARKRGHHTHTLSLSLTQTHKRTHARARTRARARTHTHKRTHARTRTRARARTHTHTVPASNSCLVFCFFSRWLSTNPGRSRH